MNLKFQIKDLLENVNYFSRVHFAFSLVRPRQSISIRSNFGILVGKNLSAVFLPKLGVS